MSKKLSMFGDIPMNVASAKEMARAMIYCRRIIVEGKMVFYQMRDGRIYIDWRKDQ